MRQAERLASDILVARSGIRTFVQNRAVLPSSLSTQACELCPKGPLIGRRFTLDLWATV